MGTGFAKLKAPLIWYDLLHVLGVLSCCPWLKGDRRMEEMAGLLQSKADGLGRYTPESIWTAWKEWEFGQKYDACYVALAEQLGVPWITGDEKLANTVPSARWLGVFELR